MLLQKPDEIEEYTEHCASKLQRPPPMDELELRPEMVFRFPPDITETAPEQIVF
jgi:hypothetical protein